MKCLLKRDERCREPAAGGRGDPANTMCHLDCFGRKPRNDRVLFVLVLLAIFLVSRLASAYPNAEKAQLSLTNVTAQAVQMALSSNNQDLYLGFNDQVKLVDMGFFDLALTADQPYDFSSDTDLDGIVGGLVLSSTRLYASKDDGYMLRFTLGSLADEPSEIEIKSATVLGLMAVNTLGTRLYILDTSNNQIIVYTIASADVVEVDPSLSITGASITDMILVEGVGSSDYIYFSTDVGIVFYMVDGGVTVTESVVGDATDNIVSLYPRPTKDYIYAVNKTDKSLLVLTATTLALDETVEIVIDTADPTYNTDLTSVVSIRDETTTNTYTYVSGLKGVSVLDGNNVILDVDTTDAYDRSPIVISGDRYGPMKPSSDNYIYMSNSDGSLSVITDKPYVTIASIAYSSGGTSLGAGETATITFQSDTAGTFTVLVGGGIDESGSALVDAAGTNTGSVTASTDTTFTFAYDDNSSVLDEGSNSVYIFVEDSSNLTGRDAVICTVDTPPPAVTVNSTGFGDTRVYLNMNRLTVSDMSYYNVYASTDADAVVNRTPTPTQISQPSSGSTLAAEISGLTNDTLYYFSVEAVDQGANVGPLTTTFSSGSRITGTPQATVGPAQLMNEKGCSLLKSIQPRGLEGCVVLLVGLFLMIVIRWRWT